MNDHGRDNHGQHDHGLCMTAAQDPREVPLRLHSRITGPIAALTFPQRSLLMAELSMVAYNDPDEAQRAFAWIGFPDVTFFDRDGSQAYRVRNDQDCVIACRGTEPNEWNDIRADANAASVLAETAGRVHRGFKREVDDLWPMLEAALAGNEQPLWFCGHSLGAAMATICARYNAVLTAVGQRSLPHGNRVGETCRVYNIGRYQLTPIICAG